MWEGVHFSKVWSLKPATLLLAYSFIKNGTPLLVFFKFFSYFLETRILQNITWWLLSFYVNCEILYNVNMSGKPSNNRSSCSEVRSSLWRCSLRKDVHNFIKKDSGTGVSCKFYKISKNTFFIEHLWETASGRCSVKKGVLKSFSEIHRKTPMPESLFW